MATSFCISIYNTYLENRSKNKFVMETPLHGHKGGDLSGLWAPGEKKLF